MGQRPVSTRKGKDGHTPLDPATIEDPVARRAAERFVAGITPKVDHRGKRTAFRLTAGTRDRRGDGISVRARRRR